MIGHEPLGRVFSENRHIDSLLDAQIPKDGSRLLYRLPHTSKGHVDSVIAHVLVQNGAFVGTKLGSLFPQLGAVDDGLSNVTQFAG